MLFRSSLLFFWYEAHPTLRTTVWFIGGYFRMHWTSVFCFILGFFHTILLSTYEFLRVLFKLLKTVCRAKIVTATLVTKFKLITLLNFHPADWINTQLP